MNQELACFLGAYCQQNQSDWSKYLMWAEYAQNSLQKPATGLTPFKCILDYQPPLFPWSGEPSDLPSVTEWLRRSEETGNRAHTHLQQECRRREPRSKHPCPFWSTTRRRTRIVNYSTPGAGVLYFSIWLTGRGTAWRSMGYDSILMEEFLRMHPEKLASRPHGRPPRRLPPRVRSRSQGGGSVTSETPVLPSSHHQRELSPENWLLWSGLHFP